MVMKRFFSLFVILLAVVIAMPQTAYARELTKKEKREIAKAAKKEAKKLEKEGWSNSFGTFSLEEQLARSYEIQLAYGDDGYPTYVVVSSQGTGMSIMMAQQVASAKAPVNAIQTVRQDILNLCTDLQFDEKVYVESCLSSINISLEAVPTKNIFSAVRREPNNMYSVHLRIAYLRKPLVDALIQHLFMQLEKGNLALKEKVQAIYNQANNN